MDFFQSPANPRTSCWSRRSSSLILSLCPLSRRGSTSFTKYMIPPKYGERAYVSRGGIMKDFIFRVTWYMLSGEFMYFFGGIFHWDV